MFGVVLLRVNNERRINLFRVFPPFGDLGLRGDFWLAILPEKKHQSRRMEREEEQNSKQMSAKESLGETESCADKTIASNRARRLAMGKGCSEAEIEVEEPKQTRNRRASSSQRR